MTGRDAEGGAAAAAAMGVSHASTSWLRAGLLAGAGALEGLMLARGPILDEYSAVRLGPRGVFVDITLLCVAVLAAAGLLAATARWIEWIFLAALASVMAWTLAPASLHPFWILDPEVVWEASAPDGVAILAHVVALALVATSATLQALASYRDAARLQDFGAREQDRDVRRLAINGFVLLGLVAVLCLGLPALFAGIGNQVRGAVKGPAAFAVLIGSGALLMAGMALLASDARRRLQKKDEDPAPSEPT